MGILSHADARSVYDRIGGLQDTQGFYEDAATADLIEHGAFGAAGAVVELGCGTGRFAKELLEQHLPPDATYVGFDLSPVMVGLARDRVAAFGRRARVEQSDGGPRLDVVSASCDRFVSNYVLDLLSEAEGRAAIDEARRVLAPGGLLCLVSLTFGFTMLSRWVERAWTRLHALRPSWVGGCRPIDLAPLLAESDWEIRHERRVASFGVPSEVLVAARR